MIIKPVAQSDADSTPEDNLIFAWCSGESSCGPFPISTGKLVSLWDMLRFNAYQFFKLMKCLSQIEKNCGEFDNDVFNRNIDMILKLSCCNGLTRRTLVALIKNNQLPEPVTSPINNLEDGFQTSFSKIKPLLESAQKYCDELQLANSSAHIPRVRESCTLESFIMNGSGGFQKTIAELKERIEDELKGKVFFYVTTDRVKYFPQHAEYFPSHPPLFGQTVLDEFPEMTADIEDAGWCLAVGRGTAAVYHLMCVMDIGLVDLATRMKVPKKIINQPWNNILNTINAKIKKLSNPTKPLTARQKTLNERFSETTAYLTRVKDAWRNPTMHARVKYTLEEAEAIFGSVKSFVQSLAKLKQSR